MIMIGIDPGKTCGLAVWDCTLQELLKLRSLDFWDTYSDVVHYWNNQGRPLIVFLEWPGGNKPTFGRRKLGKPALDRKAQNVGSNKRTAQLLHSGFTKKGIPVRKVTPKQQKWTKKTFENITGWTGRSSQHARDAARMVFGRPAMPEAQYQQLIQQP